MFLENMSQEEILLICLGFPLFLFLYVYFFNLFAMIMLMKLWKLCVDIFLVLFDHHTDTFLERKMMCRTCSML